MFCSDMVDIEAIIFKETNNLSNLETPQKCESFPPQKNWFWPDTKANWLKVTITKPKIN